MARNQRTYENEYKAQAVKYCLTGNGRDRS